MATRPFWGDMHLNIRQRDRGHWGDSFHAARGHLDFLAAAYYPMDVYTLDSGLRSETWRNRPEYLEGWEEIKALCDRHNEPGRFVAFPGYEWHGDRTRWGDHNVFYRDGSGPLDDAADIDDLYAHLRERGGLAIPHHIAYMPGQRSKDWDHFDPAISPFAEIFSNHGCSETAVTGFVQRNAHMGPWTSGCTYQDALARGYRVGAMASGDSHAGFPGVYGSGLIGVWADALTRDALWDAFRARRVYGITGDRMVVRYTVNGSPMGSEITGAGPVTAQFDVSCPQALDRIEWVRNNRVLQTYCHRDGLQPPAGASVRCRLEVQLGWGPTPSYGFADSATAWHGAISVDAGALSVVQGCWTDFGNHVAPLGDRTLGYDLRTRSIEGSHNPLLPRNYAVLPTQPFIVEIDAPLNAKITIDAGPFGVTFSLREALARTQLWADIEGSKRATRDVFGEDPDTLENRDSLFHNAYKLRVLQAVPAAAFEAQVELVDPDPPAGTNWYYARVHQVNGQTAWTSPVWVEKR